MFPEQSGLTTREYFTHEKTSNYIRHQRKYVAYVFPNIVIQLHSICYHSSYENVERLLSLM